MYRVIFLSPAKKELDDLEKKSKASIVKALDELKHLGIHSKHVKKLQPPIGGYRKRVGEYRILFDRDGEIILIHHISKRADAY